MPEGLPSDLANKRYIRGFSSYLDVLTAQKTLLTNEQQWVDSTATISTNLVSLYKALGGGWDVLPEQSPDKESTL